MPEGPEIKIVTEWLEKQCVGWKIEECSNYKKKSYNQIFGSIIDKIHCKGKQIFFVLNNGFYLNSRLALQGMWSNDPGTHVRFYFKLSQLVYLNGSSDEDFNLENLTIITKNIYYNDPINNGGLDLFDYDGYQAKLNKIGADMLSGNVTFDTFYEIIGRPNSKMQICKFLMSQDYISGVGNYLKAEILYYCKIAPNRLLGQLSDQDKYNLYYWISYLINSSYQSNGATLYTYKSPDGKFGEFKRIVYNCNFDPHGNPVKKQTFKDGRTTHWVPNVQI